MKKITLLIFFLVISRILLAQTRNSYNHHRRWSFGAFVGATDNFRQLTSDGSENFLKASRNNLETRRVSFTAGINANYRISDVVEINSGLAFDDLGFKTKGEMLSYSDGVAIIATTTYHFRYITIPLDLKLNFLKKNIWNLYAGGGFSPAIFIGQATTFTYSSSKNTDNQMVGSDIFNIMGDLRLGTDYRITNNVTLTGGIFYKQFLNPTNSNLPTRTYLNATGISVGVLYR